MGRFGPPAEALERIEQAEQRRRTLYRTGTGRGTTLPAASDEEKLEFLGTRLDQPVPMAYGRHLVAGAPIFQHLLSDGTTILLIALGDGEWDAAEVVWVNGKSISLTDTNLFHFHPGLDGATGTETVPATRNQQICSFFPGGFTGLTFSRSAYIALKLPPDPTAPGPEFDVRGIYKTRRVRTFNAAGTQLTYAFSANPAWCLLDAYISLVLRPHGLVNEALVQTDKDKIDFAAFSTAATDCDFDIGGGKKRFESHVAFLEQMTLGEIFETFLALCRGYLLEQDGKLGLYVDKARASVFTFTTDKIVEASFEIPGKDPRSLTNRIVIKARDIESGAGTASKDFAPWTKTLDDETHQDFIGRIIKHEFDLGANTRERAERLGRYWMKRSLLREQARFLTTLDAGKLLPGDIVTAPKDHTFVGTREWEVLEITDPPSGSAGAGARELFCQEYDASIFSDTAEAQQGVENPSIPVEESFYVGDPVDVANTPTSQPLTQSGTTTTINVAASTFKFGRKSISYNSGSVDPGSYGTWYVFADDPAYAGGAVTYQASAANSEVTAKKGRVYFGKITTTSGGGGSGSGGGGGPCFDGNTVLLLAGYMKKISRVVAGELVLTRRGPRRIREVIAHDFDGLMAVMPDGSLVTLEHHLWSDGQWKPAGELFEKRAHLVGKVYNLEIDAASTKELLSGGGIDAASSKSRSGGISGGGIEGESEYFLASGWLAHNALK